MPRLAECRIFATFPYVRDSRLDLDCLCPPWHLCRQPRGRAIRRRLDVGFKPWLSIHRPSYEEGIGWPCYSRSSQPRHGRRFREKVFRTVVGCSTPPFLPPADCGGPSGGLQPPPGPHTWLAMHPPPPFERLNGGGGARMRDRSLSRSLLGPHWTPPVIWTVHGLLRDPPAATYRNEGGRSRYSPLPETVEDPRENRETPLRDGKMRNDGGCGSWQAMSGPGRRRPPSTERVEPQRMFKGNERQSSAANGCFGGITRPF